MYKQNRHARPSVVETNGTSLELSLPVDEDYVVQIKPVSEGGEGRSSRQITIPRVAGGATSTSAYSSASDFDINKPVQLAKCYCVCCRNTEGRGILYSNLIACGTQTSTIFYWNCGHSRQEINVYPYN